MTRIEKKQNRQRRIAFAMGLEALTLAVMALLHLTSSLGGGLNSFSAPDAGVAEAVIGIVLAYGAVSLMRGAPRARAIAIASTALAIVGFVIGLGSTLRGGDAGDIAYHVTMLPLLVLTLRALVRRPAQDTTTPVNRLERSLT
jgi:peptidoglycan/LPS O-acetylase OafA/YrhL